MSELVGAGRGERGAGERLRIATATGRGRGRRGRARSSWQSLRSELPDLRRPRRAGGSVHAGEAGCGTAGRLGRARRPEAAIAQVLGCPRQRCTVHFLRETLGHVRKHQQRHGSPRCCARSSTPTTAAPPVSSSATRSSGYAHRCRKSRRCSTTPRRIGSPSTPSRPCTGRSCARPTRSNASTAKSDAAPTSSGGASAVVGEDAATSATAGSDPQRYKKDNTREEAKELTAA